MKKLLAILLSIVMIASVVTVPAFADGTVTHGYDNLNNEPGELVIGFLGGSITVADGDRGTMNRYATRVTNWFQEEYPAKTVKQINAGIGGTGSDLGKYRVMTDIGAYAPDVVFVEYAVNDANYSALYAETVRSNMETIVRNLQSLPKVPVIVFLYSMHDNSYSNIKYTSIPDHQEVADYYGIESINFYEYMSALVEKGEFVWNKNAAGSLTNDNIHPNALGHEQYGNYIISQLESRNILHKNKEGLSRRFMATTKDTRDIKFANADNLVKTGTWENGYAGQSDDKYEAIQSTAAGDSVSFTYTSAGNDTVGVTVLRGEGTFVIDEGTANEKTGTFSVTDNNLPVNKEFASGLSAGVHTVKVVNTGNGVAKDGSVAHLKLGRIIANGGAEVNAASTAANGDHIPASMPKNLLMNYQIPYYLSGRNDSNVELTAYSGDYTSNNSYTVSKFAVINDVAAGGNWGIHGLNFPRYGAISNGVEVTQGIRYENNTATAGTYVFKARVRTLSGNPTIGATTVLNYQPTYDNVYGKSGFKPSNEWEDYKTTLSPAKDGFNISFGVLDGAAGDSFLLDGGDGVYIAPEVAYDVALKTTGETNEVIAGGRNTYKAEVVNQIGIAAKTTAQTFTWSVVDASGNAVEGLSVEPGLATNEATVRAAAAVPFGTYYLKAVSTAKNWQKTLPIQVVEGPADPYAMDHVPGAIPENLIANPADNALWKNATFYCCGNYSSTTYGVSYKTNKEVTVGTNGYQIAAGVRLIGSSFKENTYAEGENYVIKFAARSRTANTAIGVRVGVWNGNYSNRPTDVSQLQGYENGVAWVPADGSWQIIQGTFPGLTADDVKNGRFPTMVAGMTAGTPMDTILEFNSSDPSIPDGAPYFAKETPHSVTLAGVNGNTVATGNDTKFKAQLLNQLGLPGYLNQDNVTFTVGDAKGISVDGLTVTKNGATANVFATDDVAAGKYYLRANYAIDANTTWTKTLEIEVVPAIANTSDFIVPEKPQNLTTTSGQSGGSAGASWSSADIADELKVGSVGTATKIFMKEDRLTGKDSNWYDSGIFITDKNKSSGATEGERRFVPQEYTNYVFSVNARSVKGNVRAGLANNLNYGKYTIGDHGAEGVQIGTDWTEFKTTLSTIDCKNYRFNYLTFGIVTGEAADYIVVDPASFYLAEEVAYEFNVTANAASVAQGDVIELDATLLNQIGTEGTLSQEFTWVAVNDDRTEYLEGFTFEVNENDASKVKVYVDDGVAAGDYLIVAQNAEEGVSKHYTLTVSEADYDVTELTLNVGSASAVLEALTVETAKAVKVVLAAFTGERLASAIETIVTPEDGVATLTDPLALSDLSAGDKVRVFVWDEYLTPFTMKNLYKLPVVLE